MTRDLAAGARRLRSLNLLVSLNLLFGQAFPWSARSPLVARPPKWRVLPGKQDLRAESNLKRDL